MVWAAAACVNGFATLQHKVSTNTMKIIPISSLTKFAKKNLQGKICFSPYVVIEVGVDGEVGLCDCKAWLPSSVGNLFEQTLPEILSNNLSQAIRQSIADGSYEYCNESRCGVINDGQLVDSAGLDNPVLLNLINDSSQWIMPREIWIAGDRTCNLSCPSCRTKVIKNSPKDTKKLEELGLILKNNLFAQPSDEKITLNISTTGEVFASPMLMAFLNDIDVVDFPNISLHVQTNGLMAEKNWHRLGALQDRVKKITVTVDAATADTYEKLRRGGRWSDLQQALTWIANKKTENNMEINLRMVLQRDNYCEITPFYSMCKSAGADLVEYTRILNWNTFANQEFKAVDVFELGHPEYQKAWQQLDQVADFPDVFLHGGLVKSV